MVRKRSDPRVREYMASHPGVVGALEQRRSELGMVKSAQLIKMAELLGLDVRVVRELLIMQIIVGERIRG